MSLQFCCLVFSIILQTAAVQRPQALQEAVQSAVRAFHVTLDQARRAEDDSIDILAFFRLCTFRVTCNLALAIPEDALLFEQASEAVRRVTAYFKVGRGADLLFKVSKYSKRPPGSH
eukprot:1144902-Pelagomonas_calceolata.AAC.4